MHDEQIKIKVDSSDSRAQELCETRGGRPGLPSLISLRVVDVKQHSTNPDSRFATESRVRISFHSHESSVAMEIASGLIFIFRSGKTRVFQQFNAHDVKNSKLFGHRVTTVLVQSSRQL